MKVKSRHDGTTRKRRSKKFILISVAVISVIVILGSVLYLNRHRIILLYNRIYFYNSFGVREGELVNFQFHSSYEIEPIGLRERFRIVEGTDFTYITLAYHLIGWDGNLNSFVDVDKRLNYDDFSFTFDDYPDKRLVITFGRELLEMRKIGFDHRFASMMQVTFSEEYHGNVMFLYIMDKIPISPEFPAESYMMSGGERVFIGNSFRDFNEQLPPPWR